MRFAIAVLLGILVLGCETGVEMLVAEEQDGLDSVVGGKPVSILQSAEAVSHPITLIVNRSGDGLHIKAIPASAGEPATELIALDGDLTIQPKYYKAVRDTRPVTIRATVSGVRGQGASPVIIRALRADANR